VTDLSVIVPTYDRPHSALVLAQNFRDTCTGDTRLVFVTQSEDPACEIYNQLLYPYRNTVVLRAPLGYGGTGFVAPTNWGAEFLLNDKDNPPFALGFMGDDHAPRTKGWDTEYVRALRNLGSGYVYGNDLIQGEAVSTQIAITSDIVRGFGYFANPTFRHLYADNVWRDLGLAAECITYLHHVVVQHMHYSYGKSPDDATYAIGNSKTNWTEDPKRYKVWRRGPEFKADLQTLKGILGKDK